MNNIFTTYFRNILLLLFSLSFIYSQTITNNESLTAFANTKHGEYQKNRKEVEEYALSNNIPVVQVLDDGTIIEIQKIEDGKPIFYVTNNLGAATTTGASELWTGGSLGLDINGLNYDKIGEWDGGGVRLTHQEFSGRVVQVDGASITGSHATHVAGTLVAAGVRADAKGMAHQSQLYAYDWNDDDSEMATAAIGGLEESNHSYGVASGWGSYNHGTGAAMHWFGAMPVDSLTDYWFGFYSQYAADWDAIAFNAPYYLIVKAAGNDRNDNYSGEHYHWDYDIDDWLLSNDNHDPDGGILGYDCILTKGVAKNIITIGAVEEVLNYTAPSDVVMSTFSGWGPVDDGRIKPDLVGKGVAVTSSIATGDNRYLTMQGTSMASPNVTGTLALLQQHYQNTHSSTTMLSATLKGLAIHTANEAGPNDGPDYMFGWGLLDASNAAQLISLDSNGKNVMDEQVLTSGNTYTRAIYSDGTKPLKVTICWTDPPGTPVNPPDPQDLLNNRTPMLVNDLDLNITENGNTYYPWKLDPDIPVDAATNNSKNYVDNVEQVYIASPTAGIYTIDVSHDGALYDGSQAFSIIVSGNSECTDGSIIYNSDSGKFNFCEDGMWLEK